MITKTIGGDRVGAGKKMQAHLHNYYRSTHNLNEKWASTMGSGILYPAMCKLAMRGDAFDIEIQADARTIPTKGPLFGSYKMQVDVYQVPIRLYQALLHNNPLAIGLNAKDIVFPTLTITTNSNASDNYDLESGKIANSALLKYLGLSGLGHSTKTDTAHTFGRKVNAIPALAYYDIFKTYYSNKQEDKAYVITPSDIEQENALYEIFAMNGENELYDYKPYKNQILDLDISNTFSIIVKGLAKEGQENYATIVGQWVIKYKLDLSEQETLADAVDANRIVIASYNTIPNTQDVQITMYVTEDGLTEYEHAISIISNYYTNKYESKIALTPFDLSNIDDMRYDILSSHTLGSAFDIEKTTAYLPYLSLVEKDTESGIMWNQFPMNGLVLKTYQNDIYNNWLNTEWIEGENGINELSKVAVTDGSFSMDALNFAQKLYNMLNRIAISGGTYEDYQDVVWEEVKRRQIESPIFVGGMSQELMFDEVIQTAPTTDQPLGTLGGRGRNLRQTQKGGKMHIKCDEACFIIAIVSLTPRIFYTQGNEFYMTDVKTFDDLHKPAMDGIGFQDLIGERLAWWDTAMNPSAGGSSPAHRSKVGKLPAWIEYMTSVDRAFGDFAGEYGTGYMILNRNYERDEETGGIKDATTYIDPAKYNYAFAYSALDAQNFWVEIAFNIKARRLMSARLIPNV